MFPLRVSTLKTHGNACRVIEIQTEYRSIAKSQNLRENRPLFPGPNILTHNPFRKDFRKPERIFGIVRYRSHTRSNNSLLR